MSATNRNGLQRHEHDFYETPDEAIDVVLDALGIGPEFDGYVIDAGCGNGAIASRVAARAPNADVRGIEKDEDLLARAKEKRIVSVAWENADWLSWQADGTPDLVIANPPYQLTHFDSEKIVNKGKPNERKGGIVVDDKHYAERFVRKAIEVVGKKGIVAMLLRENYLVPKTRRSLREAFGLPNIHALEKRPSFNGSGTDATDYAWFVWGPKRSGKWSVLEHVKPPARATP